MRHALSFCIVLVATVAQAAPIQIATDGGWCWFSEPKAIWLRAGDAFVTGWVASNGDIVASKVDAAGNVQQTAVLYPKLERDDHDNPAFVELPDGRIAAFFGKHTKEEMYFTRSTSPGDIAAWETPKRLSINNPELTATYGHDRYTYSNPWQLSAENNRIYVFWRGAGYKPNLSWSDDHGDTWTPSLMVVCPKPFDSNQRPYVKYFSNGADTIHLLFTDGHPRNEPTNSVYYACYRAGAFWRADGTKICDRDTLPFEPKDATLVYDAKVTGAKAWVWDIVEDASGRPVAVYATFPTDTDHRYHYARFDGAKWIDTELCAAGAWFPQTPEGTEEREQNYSPGIALDPADSNRVYLCRRIDGRIELEKWSTSDQGQTWSHEAITQQSKFDNIRPYVPRFANANQASSVLWVVNERYVHYTDYRSRVAYFQDDLKPVAAP